MNIHHLELFYHVAKHEGITEAVRKMPYGIQQPALSAQLLQLEKHLGTKLFHRRPFALTSAGERLYHFVLPFFSRLPEIERELAREEQSHLRLAASAATLRHHLPDVVGELRARHPGLQLTLRELSPRELPGALTRHESDLGIGLIDRQTDPALHPEELLALRPALFLPAGHPAQTWDDCLRSPSDRIERHGALPLIALPAGEALQKTFQHHLDQERIVWPVSIETHSLEAITDYTRRGFGAGLGLLIPGQPVPADLKALPLEDCPPLVIGALHRHPLPNIATEFLTLLRAHASQLRRRTPDADGARS
ncbi:MAG: LysR family transcriptional regulator [Verrucomicrobiales bacterium]